MEELTAGSAFPAPSPCAGEDAESASAARIPMAPTRASVTCELEMYRWLRRILFLLPAESAHRLGMWAVRMIGRLGFVRRALRRRLPDLPELGCQRFGLVFPTPLGLAAGLDKEGSAVSGLFALGFGFVEVGTVTPRAQPGNPRPRLFRIPADQALVNRLGFNNPGAEAVVRHLAGAIRPGPLGINLGKNKDTPGRRRGQRTISRLGEGGAPDRGLPGCERQLAEHAWATRSTEGGTAASPALAAPGRDCRPPDPAQVCARSRRCRA